MADSDRDESPSEPLQAPLEKPAQALVEPFLEFVATQSSSGWLLLGATVAALLLANSPWGEQYQYLLHKFSPM